MSEKYKNLKVKELQELLQKNGIPHSGKKEDLIERLVKHDERKALENLEKELELDDLDDDKLLDSALSPIPLEKSTFYTKESVLSDEEDDFDPVVEKPVESSKTIVPVTATAATTTTTTTTTNKQTATTTITTEQKVTEKETSIDSTSTFKFTPITFEKKTPVTPTKKSAITEKKKTSTKTVTAKPPITTTKLSPSTKAKSISPAVASLAIKEPAAAKLDDEQAEKLRLEAERKLERAKRFGIKLGDEDKKEIRAARFGIVKPSPVPTSTPSESTKKVIKTPLVVVKEKKLDPNQELLRKRAERFGIPEKKVVVDKTKGKGGAAAAAGKKKVAAPAKRNTLTSPTIASKNKTKPIHRVQQGRIAKKMTAVQTVTTVVKKKGPAMPKEKKRMPAAIINQRNRTVATQQGGRVVTIAAAPTPTPKRTAPANGRIVTIATPNNNTKRRRGRGGEPTVPNPNKRNRR